MGKYMMQLASTWQDWDQQLLPLPHPTSHIHIPVSPPRLFKLSATKESGEQNPPPPRSFTLDWRSGGRITKETRDEISDGIEARLSPSTARLYVSPSPPAPSPPPAVLRAGFPLLAPRGSASAARTHLCFYISRQDTETLLHCNTSIIVSVAKYPEGTMRIFRLSSVSSHRLKYVCLDVNAFYIMLWSIAL